MHDCGVYHFKNFESIARRLNNSVDPERYYLYDFFSYNPSWNNHLLCRENAENVSSTMSDYPKSGPMSSPKSDSWDDLPALTNDLKLKRELAAHKAVSPVNRGISMPRKPKFILVWDPKRVKCDRSWQEETRRGRSDTTEVEEEKGAHALPKIRKPWIFQFLISFSHGLNL